MSLTPWHQAESVRSCLAPLPKQRQFFLSATGRQMVRMTNAEPALWGTSLVPAEPSRAQVHPWGEKQPVLVEQHSREHCCAPHHLVLKFSAASWAVFSLSWFGEKHLVLSSQRKVFERSCSADFKGVCLSRDGRRWECYGVMPMANSA